MQVRCTARVAPAWREGSEAVVGNSQLADSKEAMLLGNLINSTRVDFTKRVPITVQSIFYLWFCIIVQTKVIYLSIILFPRRLLLDCSHIYICVKIIVTFILVRTRLLVSEINNCNQSVRSDCYSATSMHLKLKICFKLTFEWSFVLKKVLITFW